MSGWVVFGEVICPIQTALAPKNVKLSLPHMVVNPIEMHVNGFGAFLFDGIIGDARGCAVVSLDGGRWLRMPQFFESCLDGAGLLAIVEQCCQFGLCGTGYDFAHDGAQDMDGAIAGWGRIIGSRWVVWIICWLLRNK